MKKTVRIGGASGFWGDSSTGAPQLVRRGNIDYLVFDYLAELTMSILASARMRKPELGYATDFVGVTIKQLLPEILARGIRVVSNAGGMNPRACAEAVAAIAREQGLPHVRIAVVEGDDVSPLLPQLRAEGVRDLQKGHALPETVVSANAYLGALPIKDALQKGAQIVITGRCVDSAVTLGILMHEFGWEPSDYDRLAQGSLAGHALECGCQVTGGLHTDWEKVPGWADIGYPVVECNADGSFVVGKPAGTGGLVSVATVGEQVLYEIGDPASYLLPDVTCDFRQVRLEQCGPDQVRVTGARGRAPGTAYKVCATFVDGFRCNAQMTLIGLDAAAKARRTGEALLARTRQLFASHGFGDFSRTHIEVLGAETCFGPHSTAGEVREVVLWVAVMHAEEAALELFARELAAPATSWSPGTTGFGGRPRPSASIRQCAFLLEKSRVVPTVRLDGAQWPVPVPQGCSVGPADQISTASGPLFESGSTAEVEVPLIRLAYGRSGDKGDISNIGLIARTPYILPVLYAQVTAERVQTWLAHLVHGPVRRYALPGFNALNFVCESALDGGGMASLRNDALGKGMAQLLLSMPVKVPAHLLA